MSWLQQTMSGLAWSTAGRAAAQVFTFVVTILLARVLGPDDFGLLGMTVVFTGFVALFGELGFGAALIQREHLEDRHLASVFWLNLATALALAALVAVCAPLIASFYREPRVQPLLYVVALDLFILPLGAVQRSILSRAMRFRALAVIETLAVVGSGAIALAMAFADFGAWALVAKSVIGSLMMTAGAWLASSWRPRSGPDVKSLRELLRFSSNLLGFSVLNYWARRSDDLLIGRFFGPAALGLYDRAYSIMMMPLSEITGVLGRVMFPALSRIQGDKQRVKAVYLKTVGAIALLTFPLTSLLLALAEPFVVAVFGAQWIAMVPSLRILCIVAAFQSIGTTVGWLYQSQGRTDLMLRWGALASVLIIAAIGVGTTLGSIEAVALCYAIMTVGLLSYPQFAIPGRLIGLRVTELARVLWPPLLCSALMGAAVSVILSWINTWPSVLQLGVCVPPALLFYVALLRLGNVRSFTELRDFVQQRLQARRTATARGARA